MQYKAWLGLILRLYIGWQWLSGGWEKLSQPSAWLTGDSGVRGFMQHSVTLATGAHPAVLGFYAWTLQHIFLPIAPVMSYLVAFGETIVGIALIIGLFSRVALWAGAFMNLNYMLAGSTSTNPVLFTLALLLLWLGPDTWQFGLDGYLRSHRHPEAHQPPPTARVSGF